MFKERDYLFDNAKGLLAFLVVFAHITQHANFLSQEFVNWVNRAIYLIHMPAFIFISGYFSKKNNKKGIINLFALYVVWQMVFSPLAYSFIKDIPLEKAIKPLFLPQATYWYLISLVFWRVVTPYFAKFKRPLLLSLICGLLIGFTTMDINLQFFSYSRTVVFYPFFMLGYLFTKENFYKLQNKIKKHWGLLAFLGVVAIGIWAMYAMYPILTKETHCMRLLVGKFKYKEYYANPYDGTCGSALFYFIRFNAVLLFFTFIPRKKTFLTRIGDGSLFIYLTHWWFIEYAKLHYFQDVSYENGWAVLGFGFVAAALYCWLFTTKPLMKLGHFLTNIKLDRFLKEDEPAKSVDKPKTEVIAS